MRFLLPLLLGFFLRPQDGNEAGQTVPHVHIHIIPRKAADFEKNDEIYDAMDVKEKELKQTLDLDKERKDRSLEEMSQEADGCISKAFIVIDMPMSTRRC